MLRDPSSLDRFLALRNDLGNPAPPWVSMAAVRRWVSGVGLLVVLGLAGCAHRPPGAHQPTNAAPAEVAEAPHSDTAELGFATAPEPDDDPLLDRAIDLHRLRLEHRDPAERVRATFDLADAYLQRADRLAGVEFEGPEYAGREMAALSRMRADALQNAAEAYETMLRSDHPIAARRRAEVRFGLAEIRRRQGDHEAARAHLHALIRDHPDHGLASATLLHLGDDAMAEQRLGLARKLYTRAVAAGDPSTTAYARYKLGWIAINEDDGKAALEHWSQVVLESRHVPNRQALAEAAAKDCVRAYAMVGRPETAGAFFSRLYPEHAHRLLENLAHHYEVEGRTSDAAVVRGHAPGPPSRP